MMTEIKVPALGESVTEATIGQWFKKEGEAVRADEPVVERIEEGAIRRRRRADDNGIAHRPAMIWLIRPSACLRKVQASSTAPPSSSRSALK